MKFKILLLIGLILLFYRCEKCITDGIVVAKEYHPERTWSYIQVFRVGKVTSSRPVIFHTNESYSITIEKEIENKKYRNEITISKDEYNGIDIGEYYKTKEN